MAHGFDAELMTMHRGKQLSTRRFLKQGQMNSCQWPRGTSSMEVKRGRYDNTSQARAKRTECSGRNQSHVRCDHLHLTLGPWFLLRIRERPERLGQEAS
jgi:hypothetical protein